MAYTPKTSSKFNRTKKKLPGNLRNAIDDQVRLICENPGLGVLKIGDLADVRVHKFGFLGRLYLLAYEVDEGAKNIYIHAVGGHRNFYRDLNEYLKT
jgi:mRNA-degrading endonuclease RelE of RelBE toxin-antitoxin system